ncbi:MAG: hypothetical protein R3F37_00755 [Candidatus Competibacteraceae bacterium]
MRLRIYACNEASPWSDAVQGKPVRRPQPFLGDMGELLLFYAAADIAFVGVAW